MKRWEGWHAVREVHSKNLIPNTKLKNHEIIVIKLFRSIIVFYEKQKWLNVAW